jgi:2-methylcitrate dehydratase PrpD
MRMNITENQKVIIGIVGLLSIISVVGNIVLYQKLQNNDRFSFNTNAATSSAVFEGPGFKNEVVTFFDGKQYRTYSTSTPLSDSDVRAMREEMEQEFERMDEFFRRQDELFRLLWEF